jgi:hypothetical protein
MQKKKYSYYLPFLRMWLTLASWLEDMPIVPRLLLKTSNTHNFWSVGPKIMKFVLTQSLLQGACSQKVSENLKVIWDQVTLPKSGLVTPSTFSPLGVKPKWLHWKLHHVKLCVKRNNSFWKFKILRIQQTYFLAPYP